MPCAGLHPPSRLPDRRTDQASVADYAIRTFIGQDAPEPQAPAHVVVHCCWRLAAVRAGPWQSDPDFIELAHRAAAAPWSPIPRRHGRGVAAWQGAWVCPRCARAIYWEEVRVPAGAGAACPDCGALRVWEHDVTSGAGRLTCSCPTVPPTPLPLSAVAPLRPQPPADVPMPQLRTEPVHASDSEPGSPALRWASRLSWRRPRGSERGLLRAQWGDVENAFKQIINEAARVKAIGVQGCDWLAVMDATAQLQAYDLPLEDACNAALRRCGDADAALDFLLDTSEGKLLCEQRKASQEVSQLHAVVADLEGGPGQRQETVRRLLQQRASVNGGVVETPLMLAVRAAGASQHPQRLLVVQELLQGKADCNKADVEGETALMEAVCLGDLALCELLLGARADPDQQSLAGAKAQDFCSCGRLRELLSNKASGPQFFAMDQDDSPIASPRLETRARTTAKYTLFWRSWIHFSASVAHLRLVTCRALLRSARRSRRKLVLT
ncbi:unnamed protein product [Effrenium voratum]|nr:unnamed protein product [Effrenium voratum]